MKRVARFDRGTLNKPVRHPNGWLRVDGYIARAGILEYVRADGTVQREYRPPEEAFKADALASFSLVPLTNDHPPSGSLTAENTRQYQVGTIQTPHQDGDKVRTAILITDAAAIKDAESGKVELSCGYSAELDMTPGEIDGQRYDAVQRNIRGNHVALVKEGRAGPQFRIRLDSANAEMLPSVSPDSNRIDNPSKERKMIKFRIDGVEYEISEQAAQAFTKAQANASDLLAKSAEAVKAVTVTAEKASARADAAEAEVKKLKAELSDAPKKAREQISARVALETEAAKFLGEEKLDGKTDLEIKKAVAETALGIKLDGKSETYVEASYDLALQKGAPSEADALEASRAGTSEIGARVDSGDVVAKAQAAYKAALDKVQPQ